MRKQTILSGNAYLLEERNKKNHNFFSRDELNAILSFYGSGVASGKWKDYAIDTTKEQTSFSIYRHASELPFLKVIKYHKIKKADERWKIISMSGQELKRNSNLDSVIKFLKSRNLELVK